jgi:hypothetical protein
MTYTEDIVSADTLVTAMTHPPGSSWEQQMKDIIMVVPKCYLVSHLFTRYLASTAWPDCRLLFSSNYPYIQFPTVLNLDVN